MLEHIKCHLQSNSSTKNCFYLFKVTQGSINSLNGNGFSSMKANNILCGLK